jgi:hypothetical protein
MGIGMVMDKRMDKGYETRMALIGNNSGIWSEHPCCDIFVWIS